MMSHASKKTGRPTTYGNLRRERERRGWSRNYVAERLGSDANTVGRWERGKTFPSPYFRQQLCQLFGKNAQELGLVQETAIDSSEELLRLSLREQPLSARPLPLWNVPYRRNPFFIGREHVLTRLHHLFDSGNAMALSLAQAFSGLGGIGKTQTAIEYAYRSRDTYQAIFWARAETRDVLIADFVSIAGLLNVPEKDEQDQLYIVEAVKRWLNTHTGWLLILDNVEDFATVHNFLPSSGTGHLLFTTRAQSTGMFAQRLDLENMEPDEGILFLLRRAKLLQQDSLLEEVPETLYASAKSIVQLLDGLPLALDQAGAYIEETACNLTDYLDRYRSQQALVLDRRGQDPTTHPQSVAATLSLSVERVEQANPAAAQLLRFCAFLQPDAIPEELLKDGALFLGPILQPALANPLELDVAIAALRTYSLVRRNSETKTLTIHRLVQVVLKDRMDENVQRQWAEKVIRAINHIFPEGDDPITWPLCQRCLPHALVCTTLIEQWNLLFPEVAQLLYRTGTYLQNRAQYAEAEPLLQRALTIREQILGPEHPEVGKILVGLAEFYRLEGKFAQGESLFQRALTIFEQVQGPELPELAQSLNGIGVIYCQQGRYAEAEPFFQRALTIGEKVLGPDNLNTALILDNLGRLYRVLGKYTQAKTLLQRALTIGEGAWGRESVHLCFALNNLAELHQALGEYTQAELLFQRALTLREQILGAMHPRVATSLNNLAKLYLQQGNYTEAEPLLQRALTIRERTLASQHPEVAENLNDLAVLYHSQGNHAQAEPLYRQALTIRKNNLGREHPDVMATVENYARLLRETNREHEAALLEEEENDAVSAHAQEKPDAGSSHAQARTP